MKKNERVIAVSAFGEKTVAKGVVVDGVEVGGLAFSDAKRILREKTAENCPTLTVCSPCGMYVFSYPEITFTDDFSKILARAEKGKSYRSNIEWRLCGLSDAVDRICADNSLSALNAETTFSQDGFSYESARTGRICDGNKLEKDILDALQNGKGRNREIRVNVKSVFPETSDADVKNRTVLLSEFSTYFNADDVGRTENIRLASKKLDGLTVLPKEKVSFNTCVGERTEKRGFKQAKVIQDGKFVYGVGGGVCQVSTTLYNALLLAGITVTERRAHSLTVSYVEPSRDAMVSAFSDLKFYNPFSTPVYVSVKASGNKLTAKIYGKSDGKERRLVSRFVKEVLPAEPEIRFGNTEGIIRAPKSGAESELYLETLVNGVLVSRKRVSFDKYSAVKGIIGKKIGE